MISIHSSRIAPWAGHLNALIWCFALRREPAAVSTESRRDRAPPDYFLVVVSSDQFGAFNFDARLEMRVSDPPYRREPIGERQEAMLLMKAAIGCEARLVSGSSGLRQISERGAALQLVEDGALD